MLGTYTIQIGMWKLLNLKFVSSAQAIAVQHITITIVRSRGLQCFKLNRNHMENDRYWQKNNFLLFAKCLKMYSFFRICILRLQKVLLWPEKIFSWQISIWVSKKRRILCWFQICWCRLSEMPLKKARAKKLWEFWVFLFLCIFSWFFAFNFC
jgi:hypothetical protein